MLTNMELPPLTPEQQARYGHPPYVSWEGRSVAHWYDTLRKGSDDISDNVAWGFRIMCGGGTWPVQSYWDSDYRDRFLAEQKRQCDDQDVLLPLLVWLVCQTRRAWSAIGLFKAISVYTAFQVLQQAVGLRAGTDAGAQTEIVSPREVEVPVNNPNSISVGGGPTTLQGSSMGSCIGAPLKNRPPKKGDHV